jgi:hypothetical protein
MKFSSKSEWFELPTPIGEPKIEWKYNYPYSIERIVKKDGTIIWFGEGTNWVREKDKGWTYLGTDETVEIVPEFINERGQLCGGYYSEGRDIWIPCEEPIYETMYKQLNERN